MAHYQGMAHYGPLPGHGLLATWLHEWWVPLALSVGASARSPTCVSGACAHHSHK